MSFLFHQLKNHINRDPLSDWFEKVNNKYSSFHKDKPNSFQIEIEAQKQKYKLQFMGHLKDEGNCYHELNHSEILDKLESKEECIIFYGNLYHSRFNITVKPDLIIHRNLFLKYFPEIKIDLPEYLVIDILYKILNFNSIGDDILNSGNIYYHKCKLYVASDALGIKSNSFFFGKEYRHKTKVLPKKETIGVFPLTSELGNSVTEAVEWLIKLNKYYDEWLIYLKPSIKELYPNMNRRDGMWTNEKKLLAELIKEITLVWNISFNKRCGLLDKGITRWDDPLLLNNIYSFPVRESHREYIQKKMIHLNLQEDIVIEPRKIKKYEFIDAIKNQEDSLFLDIESVCNMEEKENYFDEIKISGEAKICIIGTIINKEDYPYKDFTIKYLNEDEERKIICYWLTYLDQRFKSKIRVYHWGNAEKVYLNYMKNKYPELQFPEFEMIDLLTHFKSEPIIIKGCFGYGLKEIVKNLYDLKLIKNKWIDDMNGLDAMIKIKQISEIAVNKNIPIKRYTEIKQIIYYNYMDCRVLLDILTMLEKML